MAEMRSFDPSVISHPETHRLLVAGVAPRPIAFVSSLSADGKRNLAPFSFFNAFGVNPPVVCFSPAFSGKTGKPKDTMLNVLETKECAISVVNYDMVYQTSLASAPYPRGVDEFEKAGFTPLPSVKVKPPGVAESPFIMEAKLLRHIDFGGNPGSANMLICEVVMIHVREEVINDKNVIDPRKMDQVARLGGPWYTRAAHGLFQQPQPSAVKPGFDDLPDAIRTSHILTGNDIARLLDSEFCPDLSAIGSLPNNSIDDRSERVKELIENGDLEAAWKTLLQ